MTLEVNRSSLVQESPKRCNSRFLHHLSVMGAAVLGIFLSSNPMRADTGSMDLSSRTVVPRTEQSINDVPSDEETDSDDEVDLNDGMECTSVDEVRPYGLNPKYLNCGLIYKVLNPYTEVTSFLVGAFHSAGEAAVQNPYIPLIINRCNTLYTESGLSYTLQDWYDEDCPLELMGYDNVIAEIALAKNKQVLSLDEASGFLAKAAEINPKEDGSLDADELAEVFADPEEMGPATEQDKRILQQIFQNPSAPPSEGPSALQQAWEKGDTTFMATERHNLAALSPQVYATLCTNREKIWLTELSEALQSEEPTCIAVGATHLVGKDGMVEQLEEMGFIVTKSSFSECAY